MMVRVLSQSVLIRVAVVISVAGVTLATTGSTYATPRSVAAPASAQTAPADMAVTSATVAGGIKNVQAGDYISMTWTTKDYGPSRVPSPAVYLKDFQGFQLVSTTCVRNGGTYVGDGPWCEGSPVGVGGTFGNIVFTGVVLPLPAGAATGSASATVCGTTIDSNPDPDPTNNCRTLTVTVYPS